MESKEKHYWSLPFCPEFTSETPGVIITRQRCAIGPFHRKKMVRILIFTVLQAVLIVKEN